MHGKTAHAHHEGASGSLVMYVVILRIFSPNSVQGKLLRIVWTGECFQWSLRTPQSAHYIAPFRWFRFFLYQSPKYIDPRFANDGGKTTCACMWTPYLHLLCNSKNIWCDGRTGPAFARHMRTGLSYTWCRLLHAIHELTLNFDHTPGQGIVYRGGQWAVGVYDRVAWRSPMPSYIAHEEDCLHDKHMIG